MSSALDEFRAQREAIEDLHRRLADVANLARATRESVDRLLADDGLRSLVRDEHAWLGQAERLVNEYDAFGRRRPRTSGRPCCAAGWP